MKPWKLLLSLFALTASAACSSASPEFDWEEYRARLEDRRQLREEARMNRELADINRQLTYDSIYYGR
ncbi:MAG: hypothetical protein KDD66_14350 [Bdellovibrionales bacterium]|nr:hypothetical protein [Bdellovibrionales bacterium]